MSAADDATIDVLLRHRAFVRGLARHLLVDPDAADDVVQQTWLAALRRAGAGHPIEKGWLARIARNFAFNRRRDERRRDAREAQAPTYAPLPSPAEIVAEEDERRRVIDAVLTLDEPYLTTMLLRYLRDRSESEVANQLGVPLDTVRWRLKTARARLRERLRGDDDAPRSARALAALAGWSADEAVAAIAGGKGLALLGMQAGTGLVACLMVAAWWSGWNDDDRSRAPSLPAVAPPIAEVTATGTGNAPGAGEPGAVGASDVARTARADERTASPTAARERVVLGRCVTRDGAVVVGARVESALASASTETDHDGRFSLQLSWPSTFAAPTLAASPLQIELVLRAPFHATKRVSFLSTTTPTTELGDIELAPAGRLRGRVLDPSDRPIRARIDVIRGNPEAESWWAFQRRSAPAAVVESIDVAEDGAFVVDSLEEGWYAIVASERTHMIDAPVSAAIVANVDTDVVVRMREPAADERIDVVVKNDAGRPLAGARVVWTRSFDRSVQRGPTRRTLITDEAGECVVMAQRNTTHGFLVTYDDGRVTRVDGVRGGDPRVELVPDDCAFATIPVVDAILGAPCAGARVAFVPVADATADAARGRSGADAARDRGTAAARAAARERRARDAASNEVDVDPPALDAGAWSAITDASGVARVPVPNHRYFVEVTHPKFQRFESAAYEPSTAPPLSRIELHEARRVHGIVLAAGQPVRDAHVRVVDLAPPSSAPRRRPGGRDAVATAATSNADGTFTLSVQDARGDDAPRMLLVDAADHPTSPFVLDAATQDRAADPSTPMQLDLAPGGALRGFVRSEGTRPAPGLVVTARSDSGVVVTSRVAWDGTYRFPALHAGAWRVCVSLGDLDPGDVRWNSGTDAVRIDPGAVTNHDLVWKPAPQVAVAGEVRIDGVARYGTIVHLSAIRGPADLESIAIERAPTHVDVLPSGAYRTSVGGQGTHLFAVTIDDGSMQLVARRAVSLAHGRNEVSLVVDGGTVSGTCRHPNDGAVFLRGTLQDGTRITMRARCAADSSFVLHHVPAGTYRIRGASDAKTIEVHVDTTTPVELK